MKKTLLFISFTMIATFLLASDKEAAILPKPIDTADETVSKLLPASSFDPAAIQSERLEKERLTHKAQRIIARRHQQNKPNSRAFIDAPAQMRMMNSDGWQLKTAPSFLSPGMPPLPGGFSRDAIQVLLNDSTSTTITPLDSIDITIIFSDGDTTAQIGFFLDEGDGVFDPETDFDLVGIEGDEEEFYVTDNDEDDENPDEGIWEITIFPQDDDFLFFGMEGATVFMTATDGGGSATATLFVEGIESDFSVSGTVYDDRGLLSNIMILALPAWTADGPGGDRPENLWTTLTDSVGTYTLHVPGIDIPEGEVWFVLTVDVLGVTEGLFPSVFLEDVMINGHVEGIDFSFVPPNAWIVGSVTDLDEIPIAGVPVIAENGPHEAMAETDGSGMYELGIMDYDFEWSLGPDEDAVYGEYLLPFWRGVYVPEGGTAEENFVLLPLDSQVSGTLHLGESFAPQHVAVIAWSEHGWNYLEISGAWDIPYDLSLSTWADLYSITVHHLDDSGFYIFVPEGYEAAPGDTDLDFTLVHPDASVSGQIMADGPESPPIPWAWVQLANDSITVTRHANHEGIFHLPALGGMEYNFFAFADGFQPFFDSLYVESGDEIWLDIFLTHEGGMGAAIEGIVMNEEGTPIHDATVTTWGWDWEFETGTDEDGYFHQDVPPGYYYVEAEADGYFPQSHDVGVEEGQTAYIEFYLPAVDGAIFGTVTDEVGNPVGDAIVVADGLEYIDWPPHFDAWTDDAGEYYMPVINNIYNITAIHPGFWIERVDSVEVSDAEVQVDITLTSAPMEGAVEGHIELFGSDEELWTYVEVWNENYVGWAVEPSNGDYHIDVPNGIYNIFAVAEGYEPFYEEQAIEVNDNTVIFDITLFQEGGVIPPYLFFIHDIPNDQGRQVRILWAPGDAGPFEVFTEFSIWRYVNESGDDYPIWDFIGTVPWHGEDIYSAVVPTLGDSTAYGIYWSIFMVTAHTEDASIFFDSNPIIGYSIDNLAPHIPGLLFTGPGPGEYGILSEWTGPEDEDFQYFNLYRMHAGEEFELRATTIDTFFNDTEIDWSVGSYEAYITAVDFNGNESDTSNHEIFVWLDAAQIEVVIPEEFALHQNYPNPFNPTTTIRYDLPKSSTVRLTIYDLLGREVATLIDGLQDAGFHSKVWNGQDALGNSLSGGVYICRISAGEFTQVRKMVLLK